jgi:hypothetical protein
MRCGTMRRLAGMVRGRGRYRVMCRDCGRRIENHARLKRAEDGPPSVPIRLSHLSSYRKKLFRRRNRIATMLSEHDLTPLILTLKRSLT